jgi:multiple sugar transport system permease protein
MTTKETTLIESGRLSLGGILRIKRKLNPGYLFIAPAVIFIFALVFLPTIRIAFLSVTQTSLRTGETSFVGLLNFKAILSDPNFRQAVLQTIKWTFFVALGHFTIGFSLALAMNSILINHRIRSLCRAFILLPWAVTPVVIALVAQLWGHPMISPVVKILTMLGYRGQFLPLGDPKTAQWTLIGIQIWQFTPFFMLMILAGLQTLDPALHDAAIVDGASWLQDVRYVILPHVRELILTLALFDVVTLAASFDLIWITTNGGPVRSTEVISTYLYRDGFLGVHWNRAAASGMILLLLLIVVAFFMIRQMRDEEV